MLTNSSLDHFGFIRKNREIHCTVIVIKRRITISSDIASFLFQSPLMASSAPNTAAKKIPFENTRFGGSLARLEAARKNDEELTKTVVDILHYIRSKDLDLPVLLDMICWGSRGCIKNQAVLIERTRLTKYAHLGDIVSRLHKPPSFSSKGSGEAASAVLGAWAKEITINQLRKEMKLVKKEMRGPLKRVTKQNLLSIQPEKIMNRIQVDCPTLWEVLRSISITKKQEKRNTMKSPDWVRLRFCFVNRYDNVDIDVECVVDCLPDDLYGIVQYLCPQ